MNRSHVSKIQQDKGPKMPPPLGLQLYTLRAALAEDFEGNVRPCRRHWICRCRIWRDFMEIPRIRGANLFNELGTGNF